MDDKTSLGVRANRHDKGTIDNNSTKDTNLKDSNSSVRTGTNNFNHTKSTKSTNDKSKDNKDNMGAKDNKSVKGGKKLLFKISKEDLLTAFNQGLITKDILVFNENLQEIKLSKLVSEDNINCMIKNDTLVFNEKMQKLNISSNTLTNDNNIQKLNTSKLFKEANTHAINKANTPNFANYIIKENDFNLTELNTKNDLTVLNLKSENLNDKNNAKEKLKILKFENLSDKIKNNARNKVKLLKQIEKYIECGITQKRALEIEQINRKFFERIRKAYKENGILGLVDTRGMHRKDKTKLSAWMQEYALRKYRTFSAGGFNFTELWWQIHKEAAKQQNYDFIGFDLGRVKPLFSVKTLKNFIKNYYKDKSLEHCIVTQGLDKAKSKFLPAQGNQREAFTMKNMCWQIDSSPADIIVRDDVTLEPFRPDILSVVDVFSGMGIATLVKKSNSLSLTRLLYKAIDKLGKPDMIKGDNGKDYLSKDFQSLLDGLNITYKATMPYAPEQKGMVERRFRTLQQGWLFYDVWIHWQ